MSLGEKFAQASEIQSSGAPPELGELLEVTRAAYAKYVVFTTTAAAVATTLWTAHTHVFEAADSTPYLYVSSAISESGKSRVFEVAERLVRAPYMVTDPTASVMFRKIHSSQPTVLLDEIDVVFGRDAKEARGGLLAVLNSGYRRRGSKVPRNVGDGANMKQVEFSTFCPKAFAGIDVGALIPQTRSRCIPIRLKRKMAGQQAARLRDREWEAESKPIREKWEAWGSSGVLDSLRDARPESPAVLTDRQADVWEPLLAIADMAGGSWGEWARQAAVSLHSAAGTNDQAITELALDHIREAFLDAEWPERMATADLLTALCDRDDGPWAAWWEDAVRADRTKGPASRLARILQPFEVEPKRLRIGEVSIRGYERVDFEDAWSRYLLPLDPSRAPVPNKDAPNGTSQVRGHIETEQTEDAPGAKTPSDQGSSIVPSGETPRRADPSSNGSVGSDDLAPDPEVLLSAAAAWARADGQWLQVDLPSGQRAMSERTWELAVGRDREGDRAALWAALEAREAT